MYPEYPQYPEQPPQWPPQWPPTSPYGPAVSAPPRPVARPSALPRLLVAVCSLVVTLCVVGSAVAYVAVPQARGLIATLPFISERVTGTVWGIDLAGRGASATTPTPVAGASVTCGAPHTLADARGQFTLTLRRGQRYICVISAPGYATLVAPLAPPWTGTYHLDIGPTPTGASASAPITQALSGDPNCAATAQGERCPALALLNGSLSGAVTAMDTHGPVANASVYCWASASVTTSTATIPLTYSSTTDSAGQYTLRDTPPGSYLCAVSPHGAPHSVTIRPGVRTAMNFSECVNACGLTYHDGPVLHTFTGYVIFWAPPRQTLSPDVGSARFEQLVRQYLSDVGGTAFYGLLTQYWDHQGPVRNVATLGGWYYDQTPYPRAGTQSDPLQDGDIVNEISRVRHARGWKVTPGAVFIVVTAYDTQECAKSEYGAACTFSSNSSGFCAYHSATSYSGDSGAKNAPNYLPYIYLANTHDCAYLPTFDTAPPPYGAAGVDAVINELSHEQFETITDPVNGGWYDGDPGTGEIGDKCYTSFGPTDGDGATVTLAHGHTYVAQREWSNLSGGCAYRA